MLNQRTPARLPRFGAGLLTRAKAVTFVYAGDVSVFSPVGMEVA
jgi:hypothetical protein